jgi:hypothetical protein
MDVFTAKRTPISSLAIKNGACVLPDKLMMGTVYWYLNYCKLNVHYLFRTGPFRKSFSMFGTKNSGPLTGAAMGRWLAACGPAELDYIELSDSAGFGDDGFAAMIEGAWGTCIGMRPLDYIARVQWTDRGE